MGFFRPFGLERYFAAHEFSATRLLCTSDCESMSVAELCAMEPGAEAALSSLRLGYTETRGAPSLRADIAALYRGISAEGVLVHAGAQEAILNLCLALLEKGDRVVVNEPCYQSLAEIPRALGARVVPWRFRNSGGRWSLDPEELESILEPASGAGGARLVIVNTPHNPTGALMRPEEFSRTVELCRRSGAVLLCDEVYRMLERDTAARLPAACEAYENGVSLSVLSKAWGLAGLRIGWLATKRADILDKVAVVKDYNSICASGPSEVLAGVALRNAGLIADRNRRLCASNLALLDGFFRSRPDLFSWTPPEGGSIAFPGLVRDPGKGAGARTVADAGAPGQPGAQGDPVAGGSSAEKRGAAASAGETHLTGDATGFAEALLRETGVLVLPGALYGDYRPHFRVGFGRAAMPDALARLEEWARGK